MSIKEAVSVDEAINYLNELTKLDPYAMYALFRQSYVECNKALAEHETCQCSGNVATSGHWEYNVGPLGVLNGMFGIDENGYGAIMIEFVQDKPETLKFKKYCP